MALYCIVVHRTHAGAIYGVGSYIWTAMAAAARPQEILEKAAKKSRP